MKEFNTIVKFEEGLHAKPATELVKLCSSAKSKVTIYKGEKGVDPKRILGVLTLAAVKDDRLRIVVEGDDEAAIADQLKSFFG